MKIIDAAQNKPIELIKNKIIKKRDYQDLLKIVRKNRPDLSIEEINYMFNKINKTGCSCATLANNIGKIFLSKEDEFEKYFGYSLYSSNGNIDYNRILVDLFSKFYGVAKVRLIKHDVFSFKSAKEAAEKLLGKKFDKESDATLKLFEQGYQGDGFDSDGNLLFKKRIPDVSEIIGTKNEISKKLLNIDSVKDFDELKHLLEKKGYILEYKDLEIHEKLTGLTITNFNFWTNYYFNSYNLDFTLNATSIVPKDFSNYEDFINYINNLICKGNLINVSVGPNKEVYIHTDKPFSWTKISNERAGHIMNFLGFDKEGNIKVILKAQSGDLIFSVQDNGNGIPQADIPHLFMRFSQGTSRKRSTGTGLGLYLSRQIIEAHGGKIWVESKLNKGSEFTFLLTNVVKENEERRVVNG